MKLLYQILVTRIHLVISMGVARAFEFFVVGYSVNFVVANCSVSEGRRSAYPR